MTTTVGSASAALPGESTPGGGGFTATATPNWYDSLDSFEGVPDLDLFSPRVPRERRKPPARAVHDALTWLGAILPGVALAAGLAVAGVFVSEWLNRWMFHFKESPVSPILLAVILGLLIRNTVGVPSAYEQGLKFALRTVLRIGIVLLGLRLSLSGLGHQALIGLPVIVVCVAAALIGVTWINRYLKLPRRLGALIAVGTSICGVSAIVATAPAIDAEDDEVSYAVGCITVFGMIALFSYPFLAHVLFPTKPQLAGLFLGTSIHDTSQVAGAGLMYQQLYGSHEALDAAVVIKLVRNVCMAVVIPLVTIMYRRQRHGSADGRRVWRMQKWNQVVPLFVVGFLLMACLRTVGDIGETRAFGFLDRDVWHRITTNVTNVAPWLLATAMAAVGLGTGLGKLKGLGWKPFSVGLAAAVMVGGVSVLLIKLLAHFAA